MFRYPDFLFLLKFSFSILSEELQLNCGCLWLCTISAFEYLDIAKLFVGNLHYADVSFCRYATRHTVHMHQGIFAARRVTDIYRILKHGEAVVYTHMILYSLNLESSLVIVIMASPDMKVFVVLPKSIW